MFDVRRLACFINGTTLYVDGGLSPLHSQEER
jgi:hypothetical protein